MSRRERVLQMMPAHDTWIVNVRAWQLEALTMWLLVEVAEHDGDPWTEVRPWVADSDGWEFGGPSVWAVLHVPWTDPQAARKAADQILTTCKGSVVECRWQDAGWGFEKHHQTGCANRSVESVAG